MADLIFLAKPITDRAEGEAFIALLHANSLMFHFEDDVHDIIWGELAEAPTYSQLCLLDQRRDELYELEWDEYECPIGYALHIMKLTEQ